MKKPIFALLMILAMIPLMAANWGTRNAGNKTGSISVNGEVLTIDSSHQEIHEGHMFSYSARATSSAGITTLEFSMKTGAKAANVTIGTYSSGASTLLVWEGRATTGGTSALGVNVNRASGSSALSTFALSPSVPALTTTGVTKIIDFMAPAGAYEVRRVFITGGAFDELVLKPNTLYLFRIDSGAVSSDKAIRIGWYE